MALEMTKPSLIFKVAITLIHPVVNGQINYARKARMAVIEKRKDALFPNAPCAQVLKKGIDEESINKTEESTGTEEP